jgi:hypothetical protein
MHEVVIDQGIACCSKNLEANKNISWGESLTLVSFYSIISATASTSSFQIICGGAKLDAYIDRSVHQIFYTKFTSLSPA